VTDGRTDRQTELL